MSTEDTAMRALRFETFGDPSVLQVAQVPTPQAGHDEVVVEVHASSVNPSDVKNVSGKMPHTTVPRTPGRDFSGVVVEGPKPLVGTQGHLMDSVGLSVSDLDAWNIKLKAENVKFLKEPFKIGSTRALMIEGPSHEAIELVEVK